MIRWSINQNKKPKLQAKCEFFYQLRQSSQLYRNFRSLPRLCTLSSIQSASRKRKISNFSFCMQLYPNSNGNLVQSSNRIIVELQEYSFVGRSIVTLSDSFRKYFQHKNLACHYRITVFLLVLFFTIFYFILVKFLKCTCRVEAGNTYVAEIVFIDNTLSTKLFLGFKATGHLRLTTFHSRPLHTRSAIFTLCPIGISLKNLRESFVHFISCF